MTDDDWWAQAVDQFGLDATVEPDDARVESTTTDDEAPPEAAEESSRRRRRHNAVDWFVVAAIALVAAVLLRVFIVQQFAVDGDSMLGTLHSGDRVLVNKLSYHLHDPHRGDIVVLKEINSTVGVPDLIKRIVGLPGETIEYRDCQLFINGELVDEPYLDPTVVDGDHCGLVQPLVRVQPAHVFVMGDNRGSSLDSRTPTIGQIPIDHLIGRAFVLVWPFSHFGWL